MKIAILSYNMYPYLHRPDLRISGGAELQLATLARQLSENGWEVVFFTGDFGQDEVVKTGGFTFVKQEINGSGALKKILYFAKRIRQIKPDFFLERGTSIFTTPGVLLCKFFGIPYIFCGASDINFARHDMDPSFRGSRVRQRLYHWSLRYIRHFVIQKNNQAVLLNANFGIRENVTVVMNFLPPAGDMPEDSCSSRNVVEYDAIWVANLIPYKQPELFIRLAHQNPGYRFLLIGAAADKAYDDKIRSSAAAVSNLTAVGYVPPAEIIQWMKKSRIVVNTTNVGSGYEEGFSNVQIMGWMCGLPSLTLISDPDGLIRRYQMGYCSGNFEQLCIDFVKLMADVPRYDEMSRNAAEYAGKNHNAGHLLQKYLDIFNRYKKIA